MRTPKLILLLIPFLYFINLHSQSIRGLSVLNDNLAWVSGSSGFIAAYGDDSLNICELPIQYRKKDFRDIHAFSDRSAIVMSIADSGILLKTWDCGRNWVEVFRDNDSGVFFDAIEFTDSGNLGILLGDPLPSNPNFLYFRVSLDSGNHWIELENGNWNKTSSKMNALFAASGSSMRLLEFNYNELEGVLDLQIIIGGGGDNGASIRMAIVQWNLYGELQSESVREIPLALPPEKGWGIYGLSKPINGQIAAAGGHWQFADGLYSKNLKDSNAKTNCQNGLFWVKFSRDALSVKPVNVCNYLSAAAVLNENKLITVGSNGFVNLDLPRKKEDGFAILSWDHPNFKLKDFLSIPFNKAEKDSNFFRGLNAVEVSENYVWIVGVSNSPLLLKVPKSSF